MEEKIKRDRMEMRAAVGAVTGRQYWSLPMLRPVPGEVTSLYGLRRVFNGQSRNPHKGLDLDAKQGDPVYAADDGVVVLVSDHYYGGNTVVVDHGLGVLTAYLHLSDFNVNVGQQVKRGDAVGFIGSTGRVTGPHLHLSLYVMGESINPLPLLSK
jgi:murein DD-endopeptidase MepM/ murein hydrolase activator NlpD